VRLARFAGSKRSQLPRSVYQALVDVLTLAARDYEARHTSFSSTMAGVRGVFDEVLHPVVKVRGHAQLACSSCHNVHVILFHWASQAVPRSNRYTHPYGACLCYKMSALPRLFRVRRTVPTASGSVPGTAAVSLALVVVMA
jgi:hypothetical protein